MMITKSLSQKNFGLLGEQLGHSFSPQLHQALGGYPYQLIEKKRSELADFLRSGAFDGLNVTIPYKQAVLPYLQELSPIATEIGSVNTIVRRADGSLYGDNTDYVGFAALMDSVGVTVAGKRVLVLGNGGASLTVQTYLRHQGAAEIFVASRRITEETARTQGATAITLISYRQAYELTEVELIINTTPVGMEPHNEEAPLELTAFSTCSAVIDLIYNPLQSRLLSQAAALGMKTANGLLMLVEQAAAAVKLFTEETVSVERVKEVHRSLTETATNLILIGMPGCGKSTVARLLATGMKRPWLDADVCFEERYGRTPAEVIVSEGEAVFREMETKLLAALTKRRGVIIATGGGVVTRSENLPLLRQNGRIYYIKRDINDLSTKGRPLSDQRSVEALYRQRRRVYEDWADDIVYNWSSRRTCQLIIKRWKNAYSGD
ncbi:MAG: shikimate kinase [Eubacteriales bacterium]|nr:shikimate kinase [Eubacteriales bacterium]